MERNLSKQTNKQDLSLESAIDLDRKAAERTNAGTVLTLYYPIHNFSPFPH